MRKLLIAVRTELELYRLPEWLPHKLQECFPELNVVALDGYDATDDELPDAEVFVGWSLPAKKLALASKLKWMHSLMTGVAQLCYSEMVASPVVLTNAATVHAPVVAEHAWALIMAMSRRIPSGVRAQDRREWAAAAIEQETPRLFELGGLTMCVVGLGAIGSEVARRARAFGMRVIAVKRRPERGREDGNEVVGPDRLLDALTQADVVVLAAPSTPETRHLIGERELAAMKPAALLVNVARGTLIDEAALVLALEERRIGGAALDVTETEPLPAESPLWRAPNVLITPHLASATERLWNRHYELLDENVRRYLAGQSLLNVVDKAAGY